MANWPSSAPSPHAPSHNGSAGCPNGIDIFQNDDASLSKILLLEIVVGAALDESVLEGQLGVITKLIVVLLLRVAADDVVGLLLVLVDFEALEAEPALGRKVHAAHVVLHASEVGGNPHPVGCLADRW